MAKDTRLTQKKLAFYLLWSERTTREFIPAWRFVGEIFMKELNEWGFMSYKCPARVSDLYLENPGLLEREWMKGKSGTDFYGYRFVEGARADVLQDPKIKGFYLRIKREERARGLSTVRD